jgi:hypothetical protein
VHTIIASAQEAEAGGLNLEACSGKVSTKPYEKISKKQKDWGMIEY